MDIKSFVTPNKIRQSGVRAVVYGDPKIGKTQFIAQAPKPFFIPMEVGYAGVRALLAHTGGVLPEQRVSDYSALKTIVSQICQASSKQQFPFQSICIDSVTALQSALFAYVVSLDKSAPNLTMDTSHKGYGRAYKVALQEFQNLLSKLDYISSCGVNILFTSHCLMTHRVSAIHGEYVYGDLQLYTPKNDREGGLRECFTQWLDVCAYLHCPFTTTGEKGLALAQDQNRVLNCINSPNFVSGNRFGIDEVIDLPFYGWNLFAKKIYEKTGIDISNTKLN